MVILGNTNPVKLGRCFSFLDNWYGFEHGGDRKSSEKVFSLISSDEPKTQKELAESYGITQQTMNNYMRMAIGTIAYNTKEEVMEWMLDIQLGRRNLSPIQRIAVAEKYRPIYEKQARENQLSGLKQNQNTVSQNSSKRTEPIDVRAKLAETAGVSTDTYSKGKKILDSNNEDLKQEVLSGEKSIDAGYKELTQSKNEEKTRTEK